jgi:hypothetical protein
MSLWGNNDSVTVSGTVTITKNADNVTGNVVGSSTSFNTTAKPGNYIISGGNTYAITTVGNSTFMTIKSGKNGANIVAQTGGSSYNIQQGPAFVPLSESSDHPADGIIMGNAELVYGVDSTEMAVTNGSIIAYTTTFAGSGYSANAVVTVGGNATANGLNAIGRISVLSVLPGNTYTTPPTVTVAAPTAQNITANTLGVVAATDFIKITSANSIYLAGDKVLYTVPAGNTAITPLTGATSYYISFSNTTGVVLAASLNGANIDITDTRTTATAEVHTFTGERATAAAVISGARQGAAHAGWVRRVVGTGGRAGRVQEETLVAMGSIAGDLEDTVMKDA